MVLLHRVTAVLLPPRPTWLPPPSVIVCAFLDRLGVRACAPGAHVPPQLPGSVALQAAPSVGAVLHSRRAVVHLGRNAASRRELYMPRGDLPP